ncbi:MAG: hypothetical protein PVJ33_08840 [Lysobacterales bacterium]|jgi:hypothetical protein
MNVGIVALLVVAIADIAQAGNDRMLAPLKGSPKFDQMLYDIGLR